MEAGGLIVTHEQMNSTLLELSRKEGECAQLRLQIDSASIQVMVIFFSIWLLLLFTCLLLCSSLNSDHTSLNSMSDCKKTIAY